MDFESDDIVAPQALTETTKDKLRSYVARLENLEAEKQEVADQIKDVYADAKALGFDTKALRKVITLRKKDQKKRQEEEMMLELYLHALGEI
ncbi:MAG: DUF2312 domain-containing protein [Caulobacterales bacterium]|nr:DUF2312 domain-containing protein [Caulobacterales bacterium]MCA0371930.1 DUF2312 domain-containing protein [Pseudomonadota bacterium]